MFVVTVVFSNGLLLADGCLLRLNIEGQIVLIGVCKACPAGKGYS